MTKEEIIAIVEQYQSTLPDEDVHAQIEMTRFKIWVLENL